MTRLTNFLANLAPWCAPAPTAWIVAVATMRHLAWPWYVALVAAVTIELLGLSASVLALEFYSFNATKRKDDPAAPFVAALGLLLAYVATAIILTVALDIVPPLARYAPAIFPLLSLAAFVILAMRQDHAARVAGVAQDKADGKVARAQRKQDGILAKQQAPAAIVATKSPAEKPDWRKLPAEDRQLIRDMTPKQVAKQYAVKERTARGWVVAARRNGHGGIEVTE